MAFDAGAVVGTIELRYDKAVKSLKAVEQQTQRTMGRMSKLVKDHREQIGAYGRTMVVAGAAVAGGFALMTRKAIQFDAAMRNVNTIARLTEGQLRDVRDQVIVLSMETGEAADVLAAGLYDIYSAGLAGADALAVLAASAKAAVAGISDTATAAGALLTALASWGIEASQVNRVSDVLFKTIEKGRVNFQQLAMILAMGAGLAKDVGVSLEEFGAAVAVATARTIRARSAGEYFRQMMTSLIKPSTAFEVAITAINKRIDEFEFATGKSMITALGLGRTMQELKRYSDATGVGMEELFSEATALQFALALTADGGEALIQNMQAMEAASGATGDAFEEQGKAVERQMKIMKESINALAITIGHTLLPSITKLINEMQPTIKAWLTFTKANKELVRSVSITSLKLAGLTTAVGLLALALSSPTGLAIAITAVSSALILGAMHWDEYWAAMEKTTIELPAHVQAFGKLQEALKAQAGAQRAINIWIEAGLTPMYEQIVHLRDTTAAVIAARAEYEKLAGVNRKAVDASEALEDALADLENALTAIGGAAKKTALEVSQEHERWLRTEYALAKAIDAKLAAAKKFYEWVLVVVEKYRDSAILAEREWAAHWQEELDRIRQAGGAWEDLTGKIGVAIDMIRMYRELEVPPTVIGAEGTEAARLRLKRAIAAAVPGTPEFEAAMEAYQKFIAETKDAAVTITTVWETAARRIQGAFADAIYDMMRGVRSLADLTQTVVNAMLRALAELWATKIMSWWGKTLGLPFLAAQHGGIVTKPTVALVGEAGPEKITPLTGPMAGQEAMGAPINITIQAIDARSGLDFLMTHRREIGMALQGAFRDFAPVRRGG